MNIISKPPELFRDMYTQKFSPGGSENENFQKFPESLEMMQNIIKTSNQVQTHDFR